MRQAPPRLLVQADAGGGPETETQPDRAVAPTGPDRPARSLGRAWRWTSACSRRPATPLAPRRLTDVVLLASPCLPVVVLDLPGARTHVDRCARDRPGPDLPGSGLVLGDLLRPADRMDAGAHRLRAPGAPAQTPAVRGAACGLAVGFALLAGWLAGTNWSDSFKAVTASGSPPIYLAVRLALATAVVVMASPYMARPWNVGDRWWDSGRWPGSRWGPPSPSG